MMIKDLTQIGSRLIRSKNKKITDLKSKASKTIIKDLIDSMRCHELIGIAGPQIGKNVMIFVSELRPTPTRKNKDLDILRVYINPLITWRSKKKSNGYEGCGSVASANLFAIVTRPSEIIVEATNERGEKFSLKAAGLLARVIQHEYDHIHGILFTDKSDPKTYMSKNEYRAKMAK